MKENKNLDFITPKQKIIAWIIGTLLALCGVVIAFLALYEKQIVAQKILYESQDTLKETKHQIEVLQKTAKSLRGSPALFQIAAISYYLFDRSYLVHPFSGQAKADCKLGNNKDSLIINVVGKGQNGYGGVNIFADKNILPEADPIELKNIEAIEIWYVSDAVDKFFIKLKNTDGFETDKIFLTKDQFVDKENNLMKFKIKREHPAISTLFNNSNDSPCLLCISIATEVNQGESRTIEIEKIKIYSK